MSDPAAPADPSSARTLRTMKAVVILLGVLIVLGLFALVAGIIWKSSKPKPAEVEAPPPAQVVTLPTNGTGPLSLPLPQGATISEMALDGDRVALQIKSIEGEELIVIDIAQGKVIGRVRLVTTTPTPEPTP